MTPMVKLMLAALVPLLALTLWMRYTSTGVRRLREGRVTGIVGRKGHGKSLFTVHELLRSIGNEQVCKLCSRNAGRRVTHRVTIASNVNLTLPPDQRPYFRLVRGVDDLYNLPHMTFVALDEVQLWWPAIQGQQLPERVVKLITQCRKLVLEIVWISQHEDRVALGLRRLTDEIGVCERGWGKFMRVRLYQPENVRKPKLHEWTFRYRVTKKLAAAYNTYEFMEPQSEGLTDQPARAASGGPKPVARSVTTSSGTRSVADHLPAGSSTKEGPGAVKLAVGAALLSEL